MMRSLFGVLAPGRANARLSVLVYHRVLPSADPLFPELPEEARFDAQMRWVRQWFNVLPLAEAVARLRARSLPSRAMSITFDDGYADNATIATPVLERLGLTATFFVSTGFLDGGIMWNDAVIESVRASRRPTLDLTRCGLGRWPLESVPQRRAAIDAILHAIKHLDPDERRDRVDHVLEAAGEKPVSTMMMTSDQVSGLAAAGMSVGGHTVTHPILARLPTARARTEIAEGKARLESILRDRVELFAYPNGVPVQDYAAEHVKLVQECGFRAAVSTAWGAAAPDDDVWQLPRFTPWDRTRTRFGLRLARNLMRRKHDRVQC